MASKKQFTIEIRFNEDAELGTAILFFQKLVSLMSKFGLTYFREATVHSNYKELARYETSSTMTMEIKEFHEEKMREQSMRSTTISSIDEDVN